MRETRLVCFAVALMLVASINNASAQRGGGRGGFGGPPLEAEKAAAAQEAEAKSVAGDLSLSGDDTGKLVAAYQAARKSLDEAMQKARDNAGGGFGGFQAIMELPGEEKTKFKTAIAEFLSGDQAGKAADGLAGGITLQGNQVDRMVDAFGAFSLGDDKLFAAVKLVLAYAAEADAARAEAIANQDFQSIRTGTQAAREKLETALGSVLSAEDLTKWKEANPQGGGRGGGRGGGFRGN